MSSLPQQPSLRDYLRPVIDRRWWVVAFVAFAVVVTYVYYAQQPKVYEASTKILVQATSNPLDPVAAELSDRTISDQADLLTSRSVANEVAKRLHRPERAVELAQSVTGESSPGSNVVTIVARRGEPRDAALVANAFAQAFVQLRSDAARDRVTKGIDETQAQLNRLPRTPATSAERASLNESIRQLQLTRSVTSGSASQVDPALPPTSAAAPHPKRSALLALVLALIGACGLAFAIESLDRRPRRLEELSPLYGGLPILAVMPHSDAVQYVEDGRAAVDPRLKEPLRQLRTNIQLAALDQPFKRILITSAVAGEGKSTVVRNLAIVLREGGLKVAVVDSDLRKPTLSGLFAVEPVSGLTDVLTGGQTLEHALVNVPVQVRGLATLAQMEAVPAASGRGARNGDTPEQGTISLLAAGPLPADPQSVLAADRTRLLLSDLSSKHDIVLIDSPPLLPVTDAVALAADADAVVVVGRLGRVTRDNAQRLAEILGGIPGAHPIGIVVNDAPVADGVNYGYGYGYGS